MESNQIEQGTDRRIHSAQQPAGYRKTGRNSTSAGCVRLDAPRRRAKIACILSTARWLAPACIAVLLLAAAELSNPIESPAKPPDVKSGTESAKETSQHKQVSTAEDPNVSGHEVEDASTSDDPSENTAEPDAELSEYLYYLRGPGCDLTEHQKLLDEKAVHGATRTELHSLGYDYPEIEASFKRVLAFLDG